MHFWNERSVLSTLYFAGLQTLRTNIKPFRGTVYFATDRLNVGFPNVVGSSMRMAHVISEMCAFSANCTCCHRVTSLLISLFSNLQR